MACFLSESAKGSQANATDRSGKITLIATILMLGLAALAGLVGNAGHCTHQKIVVQNAADSVAFSSALWMARGMNALTATNHMIGESTGMLAVHESIGGPELDVGIKLNTSENRSLNAHIRGLKRSAPIGTPIPSPFGFTPPLAISIDTTIVNFVTGLASPTNDAMTAFASLYDARMTLKRELILLLSIKSFADIGFLVPPPWGFATAAVAYGVHLGASSQIVLIGKEWIVLEALEAVAKIFKMPKGIIESQLVPTLAAHTEFIAGYDRTRQFSDAGIVNGAIERAASELETLHAMQSQLYPQASDLRLPVVPEPKPNLQGQTGGDTTGWGSDTLSLLPTPQPDFEELRKRLNDAKSKMEDRQREIRDQLDQLDRFSQEIKDRQEADEVSDEEESELNAELIAIARSLREQQSRLEEIERSRQQLAEQESELSSALDLTLPARSENPSTESLPKQLNQDQERVSQWSRATYPYADLFRAPLVAWLKRWAPKSKAAEHVVKWSNRYTLVKAWQYRSGYRFQKSGSRGRWTRSKSPLSMFVMREAFDGEQSRKGIEPWTGSDDLEREKAEQYFTLIGMAHRKFQPLFSEVLYPAASDAGMSAYAQAIFYNANRPSASDDPATQPVVGWDTLNWDPKTEIPEWGATATESSAKWPWEIFDLSTDSQGVAVRLNWQAKLMPVTTSRLKGAAENVTGDLWENINSAAKCFDKLGTH